MISWFIWATARAANVSFLNNTGHPPWEVLLVDTGLHTEKASRIVRVGSRLKGERFFVAYGDDVSDVDLGALVRLSSRTRQAGDADGRPNTSALWRRRS